MKQYCLLFYLFLLAFVPRISLGQDANSYNDLVISEVSTQTGAVQYIELTNMGTDTLDLAKYWLSTSHGNFNNQAMIGGGGQKMGILAQYPGHVLLPGETFSLGKSSTNNALDVYGKKLYPNDYINPDLMKAVDYVFYVRDNLDGNAVLSQKVIGLFTRADTNKVPDGVADSVLVDQFWFQAKDAAFNGKQGEYPIAGKITAWPHRDFIYARKPIYKKGNTDFNQSRGTNLEDSEWIPLPKNLGIRDRVFTTIDKHMNQENLEMVPKSRSISVDVANGVINLPYDIAKDSLFRQFDFGPNHAWRFFQGPDTASYYAAEGDTVEIYVVGDQLKTFRFALKPQAKPANFAKVYPLIYKNTAGNFTRKYTVSDGHMPMDTIGQIAFGTPVDSLDKFLVKDPDASFTYVWVDNTPRPEVKDGDILRVTAGGNSKDYLLVVWPYVANNESRLRTVAFPGTYIWENPATYELTDTMLNFTSGGKFYLINLPSTTTVSPSILVTPMNNRSKVKIISAKNLDGSDEDRTINVEVTAEDDSTITKYQFLLNVERETPPIVGTPFICDIAGGWGASGHMAVQFFNPADEVINISDYFFMYLDNGVTDFVNYVENTLPDRTTARTLNGKEFRPGFAINHDIEGNAIFQTDFTVSRLEIGPQEEFLASGPQSWPASDNNVANSDKVDMLMGRYWLGGNSEYWKARWGGVNRPYENLQPTEDVGVNWLLLNNVSFPHPQNEPSFALFKIVNDSVKNGTKPVYKDFFKDYELVDVVNGLATCGVEWELYYTAPDGKDSLFDYGTGAGMARGCLFRNSDVYTGNAEDRASFGTKDRLGEWTPYGLEYLGIDANGLRNYHEITVSNDRGDLGTNDFGRARVKNHTMVTAAHVPYLTSTVYMVSKGLSANESIYGISPNSTITTLLGNLIKADSRMEVTVKSAGGIVKSDDDKVVTGDKVTSTSANGLSQVMYTLNVGSLSNDVTLAAKAGAEFSIVAPTKVEGVPFGMTLQEMMDKIIPPANANVVVTNGSGYVLPFVVNSNDTNVVGRVEASVLDTYVIEVTAQDGVTKANYAISYKDDNNVFVSSDVYAVDQTIKEINYVSTINVANFLANLIPSPGAQIKVINKLGQQREIGIMQYHDRLSVTKGNVTVNYYIKFMNELVDEVKAQKVEIKTASVYPNPSNGDVVITGLSNVTNVRITSITGQVMQMVNVNSSTVQLNLNYKPGIYLVSVMNKNRVIETHELIIK